MNMQQQSDHRNCERCGQPITAEQAEKSAHEIAIDSRHPYLFLCAPCVRALRFGPVPKAYKPLYNETDPTIPLADRMARWPRKGGGR